MTRRIIRPYRPEEESGDDCNIFPRMWKRQFHASGVGIRSPCGWLSQQGAKIVKGKESGKEKQGGLVIDRRVVCSPVLFLTDFLHQMANRAPVVTHGLDRLPCLFGLLSGPTVAVELGPVD